MKDNFYVSNNFLGIRFLFLVTVACFFILSVSIFTQSVFGQMVPYDKETFTTIEGKVKDVYTNQNKVVSESGLHLTVETPNGDYVVHVCPAWYADLQQFNFGKGELLTISGSAFIKDQQKGIYAATITRRFSALPKERQIQMAFEAMSSTDLKPIATKYGVELEEVERVKGRAEHYINKALFPEPIDLRDKNTGDGLWGGRFFKENMPFIRQKRQEEIRQRMQEGQRMKEKR